MKVIPKKSFSTQKVTRKVSQLIQVEIQGQVEISSQIEIQRQI